MGRRIALAHQPKAQICPLRNAAKHDPRVPERA
jgi:hypothetical protein